MARVIAVSSPKGGVGKTACAYLTAVALVERGLRVAAVDADHDVGTLPLLVPAEARVSGGARQALTARRVTTGMLARDPSGVEVLAGPIGPADDPARSAANLGALVAMLDHDAVVLDLGTGLSHPVIRFALDRADHVLMVTGPELIGASRVEAALRRLVEQRRIDTDELTLVLNRVIAPELAAAQLERFRRTGVRHDVAIPDDEHLSELLDAGAFAIGALAPGTQMAIRELAEASAELATSRPS
jgi:flagellar biosynthesis protein FlhG